MGDFRMAFVVRPATVATATYAAMMVLGEHTRSLEVLDDVRLTLDELLTAVPDEGDVRGELVIVPNGDSADVSLRLGMPGLSVHDSVDSLVDGFQLEHESDATTARFLVHY